MSIVRWFLGHLKILAAFFFITSAGLFAAYKCNLFGEGELFANLFAEVLGAALTVFIVDAIIKWNNEKQLKPIRKAAYNDMRILFNRFKTLWSEMYKHAAIAPPAAHENLFSQNSVDLITSHLNLNKLAPVVPNADWSNYLHSVAKDYLQLIDKYHVRYMPYIDPEIISIMRSMESSAFLTYLKTIPALQKIRIQTGAINNFPPILEVKYNNGISEFIDLMIEFHGKVETIGKESEVDSELHILKPVTFESEIGDMIANPAIMGKARYP